MNDRKVDYPVLNGVAVDRLDDLKELVRGYIVETQGLIDSAWNQNNGQGNFDGDEDDPVMTTIGIDENGEWVDISWKNYWDNRQHAIDTRKVAILHAIDELLEVA